MQAMIDELAKQAAESLDQVSSKETLASFWQEYLSKNGKIPALMKNLRTVAPEERPAMGKIINELKQKVQADYDAAAEAVKQAELAARNAAETVDITLPAICRIPSICPMNSCCAPRPPVVRSAPWTARSRPSRCSSRAASSAPTPTPPTAPCSIRWRVWWWIRASRWATCRAR